MPWWESNPKLAEIAKFSVIEELTITAKEIGRGSYGTVYAAVHNGKPCVAKEIHPYLKHDKLETFVREINTLSTLKHPSIVQFLGVHFKTKSHTPILVMELMWKNLYSLLEEQPKQLPLLTKVHILHDVTCGLQYLHSQKKPVVHRDLHPSNILLNENLIAKIADLGLAKPLNNESAQKLSTAPGNISYMAPETLKKKPTYDTKLDVFSTGCTIIHLVTEQFPAPTDQYVESKGFEGSFHKVSEADRRIEYLNSMKHVPMLQQIARHCLEDAPTNRPTASDICKMLEGYIPKLEAEVPSLAKRHKQDKLSLLRLLQSQEDQLERKRKIIEDTNKDKSMLNDAIMKKEEYISSLESDCQEYKRKIEENEVAILSLNKGKESLQKELTTLNETNKSLNATYKNQVDIMREDIKSKQQEIKAAVENKIQMQNDIDDLKSQLSNERLNVTQKMQLISELDTTVQKLKIDADSYKEEKEQLFKANSDYAIKIKVLEQHICELESKSAENDKQIEGITSERDSIIADLNESLKIKEQHLTESVSSEKDIKSKYINLQQSYKALQETLKKLQAENFQSMSVSKRIGDEPGSLLHKKLLELQKVNEEEHRQLQQDRQSLMVTFEQQDAKIAALQAQLADSKKKLVALKQQIEEKSYRLSKLESSLNELQDSTHSKEGKIKSYEENIAILNKQLENNDRIQRNFEKDLKAKGESLKRKEEELQLQKKEHADEINNLRDQYKRKINDLREDIERYKSQIVDQEEISKLLNKEADYKSNLEKSIMDRFQRLENERKSIASSEKNLKRQIKHKDADIKDKIKQIESLEKGYLKNHSMGEYNYDIHWYPYLSLPVKLIRPSVAIIKDKVFVTGGYQCSPQGRRLEDYSQVLEDKNSISCFNLTKCHCDAIASPVLLGTLANMNGQCVLVSGVDSVGNTLTGNVYAFEEGSHDQWKEFSEPLPTPRILASACCYGKKWLIVCGGFVLNQKEESGLLEAVNIMEVFDTSERKWHALSEENCPDCSTVLCCAVVGEELYVVGSDQVIKTSCNNFLKATTSNNALVWDNVLIETEESDGNLHPFSIVEVNGEPMIIASMSDGEDDATCVLMKGTGGRWRIVSKAVECQHCSAAVVTSSLELLLFGGSERVSVEEPTDISQKGNCIPNLNIYAEVPAERILPAKSLILNAQGYVSPDFPITINQPANLFFTGPVHTVQFNHNGGTFQSPIHKVSLVVPPNSLSDDEKVTVYMGATTSGPFDLPEDCKLRSAVVWLSVSPSDVEFKRSISVIVPHSAVFINPEHHSMMRFVICEDCEGPRYKFSCSFNQYEIDGEQGVIELNDFAMLAIIAGPEFTHDPEDEGVAEGYDSDDDFQDAPENVESLGTSNGMATNGIYRHQKSSPLLKKLKMPPACYLAKLFWPRGELPSSFKVDVYYLQNLPTEFYKVDTLYRNSYYEDNGSYPEIMSTQFMISGSGADLQCVLPCSGSNECDCLTNWDVTPMNDVNKVSIERDDKYSLQYKNDPMRFSFKFSCLQPSTTCRLTCCFELHGVDHIGSTNDQLPTCLRGRSYPFILEQGIYQREDIEQQVNGYEIQDNNEAGVAVRSCQPTDII